MSVDSFFTLDMPQDKPNIIKVIGVGGGGSNAVNYMFRQGIKGVDFVVCNTDLQALHTSPVPKKIQLGGNTNNGLGAGQNPEVGKKAALESLEDIMMLLQQGTEMVFITAGLGGGTGTGAAPVIAKAAKESGILTVAIITMPFGFEGPNKRRQADEGLAELRKNVDAIIVISNDRLKEIYKNMRFSEAFSHADDVLTTAAKGIAEIITIPGYTNVDFMDVKATMLNSGIAIMSNGTAEGEDRCMIAVKNALESPLLSENKLIGAKNILLNITFGADEPSMEEIAMITEYLQVEAGLGANLKFGVCYDETLDKKLSVTIIATGFEVKTNTLQPTTVQQPQVVEQVAEVPVPVAEVPAAPVENNSAPEISAQALEQAAEVLSQEPVAEEDERKVVMVIDSNGSTPVNQPANDPATGNKKDLSEDEQFRRALRLNTLGRFHDSIKTPHGLQDSENTPAYIRRGVRLEEQPHSSESNVSRFTIGEDPIDNKPEIKQNNSFLHDSAD